MKKVNILMATYNGEQYLQEQIDSILQQNGVDIDLQVRDDGSKDRTLDILSRYQDKNLLSYTTDDMHLGPAKGFLYLLKNSHEADYYAFSDQDDFWKKGKMQVATSSLERFCEEPALYFSKTQLTDEQLKPIPSPALDPFLTFGESLIYEFIPGCTMVMNKALRDIVNQYSPQYLAMHDVWIYSVALAVGAHIVFDNEAHILYRQHSNNTIGQGYSVWHEWARRWNRISNNEQSRSRRAIELHKGFSSRMRQENLSLLKLFIEGKNRLVTRLNLLTDKRLRCANKTTQWLFWLNILINKY